MNKRDIKLEVNKFQDDFSGNFIYNTVKRAFEDKVEIDLEELCAKFLLEEFDDTETPVSFYGQFPALNYLIENVREFKFKQGHPGASKDPRKENSRVLGQVMCRYFVEKTFGSIYMANVGTILGRKLPAEYAHISIERTQEGDTPDFLFMDNYDTPCLAEAKGSRKPIAFDNSKFDIWREQFDRVEVKIGGRPTKVKGYITELAIANEDNKMPNSVLYIEDPELPGDIYREGNLGQLIKLAHYERLLSKTFLNFIGYSLLSEDKLSKNKKYEVPVFKIEGISMLQDEEIVSLYDDTYYYRRYSNYKFVGITLNRLKSLLGIARGVEEDFLGEYKYENFNSVFFKFSDGFVVCNSKLLEFVGFRSI